MTKQRRTGPLIGKIAVALVLAGAAAGGVIYYQRSTAEEAEEVLTTGRVERGNVEKTVSCSGTLSAVETVDVGAQVSGTIKKLYVDFNDQVTEGQVLLELETTLFQAEVQQSRASLTKSKAELSKAKADLARVRKLYDQGFATEEDLLVASTQVETASATLLSSKASSKMSKTKLGYTIIKSPIDGTVIARNVEEGQTIASSFSTPSLFIIAADLAAMQIEADVDESDIGQIAVGQAARFTVQAYPERTYEGRVRQIRLTPQTIQNVVNYSVVVDVRNDDRTLLPGMTATVDFIVDRREDVLLVPSAALSFDPTTVSTGSSGSGKASGKSVLSVKGLMSSKRALSGKGMTSGKGASSGKGDAAGGGRPPGTGQPPGPLPEGSSLIWKLGKDGQPVPVIVTTGLDDGSVVEITGGETIEVGTMVIVGKKKSSAKSSSPALFGPPPGGGPPPH